MLSCWIRIRFHMDISYPLLHVVNDYSQLVTWYNELKLEKELCRYDLHGSCSDPDCKFQHANDYTRIQCLFTKLEKSFSALYWLRHGTTPSDKLLQVFKSEWEQTLSSFSIQCFQGPIQQLIGSLLEQDDIPPLFIPLMETCNHSSKERDMQSILANNEKEPISQQQEGNSDKWMNRHPQESTSEEMMSAKQALVERFPHSSLLWESYFTMLIAQNSTKDISTLLQRANIYCPDRNWHEWIMARMEQLSSKKTGRYYAQVGREYSI